MWIFLLFFILSQGCGQAKQGHHISIRLEGLSNTECYLAYHFGNRQYLKDTARVDQNGLAVFQGAEAQPPGIYILVLPDQRNFELIIDSHQHFSMEVDPDDVIGSATFEGSPGNKAFYFYLGTLREKSMQRQTWQREMNDPDTPPDRLDTLQHKLETADKKVGSIQDSLIARDPDALLSKVFLAQRDPELPGMPLTLNGVQDRERMHRLLTWHYFDNIDFADERLLRTPVYHSRLRVFFNNVLMQHPDTVIAEADRVLEKARANEEVFRYTLWFLTNHTEVSQVMGMDGVFVHLVDEYYLKGEAPWVDEATLLRLEQRAGNLRTLLLGKEAPDVTLYDTAGDPVSLHQVEADYLIVYFWDSECFYCREATPLVREAHQRLSDKGVKVLAVNTETDSSKWKEAIKDHPSAWIHVNDTRNISGFRDAYDIYAIPTIFILDARKRILAKQIGASHIENFIRQHMRQASSQPQTQ